MVFFDKASLSFDGFLTQFKSKIVLVLAAILLSACGGGGGYGGGGAVGRNGASGGGNIRYSEVYNTIMTFKPQRENIWREKNHSINLLKYILQLLLVIFLIYKLANF